MNKERKEDLQDLCRSLKIEMNDLYLLNTALTHTSYAHESKLFPKPTHSERIEFLGDSVLGLVVSTYMYKRFPKMDEGELTKLRAYLVCETSLSKYARQIGLGKYILLGRGELLSGGRDRNSILADAFESVVGTEEDSSDKTDSDEATTDDTKSDSTDMPGESIEESDDSTSETAGITNDSDTSEEENTDSQETDSTEE